MTETLHTARAERMTEPGLYPIYGSFFNKNLTNYIVLTLNKHIDISSFDYALPEERIAKYPLAERQLSKLLVCRGDEAIRTRAFSDIASELPDDAMLVFNNTRVIRARIIMHKSSGARIEIFCLEPHLPADYERALSARGSVEWRAIVGNSRRWKTGAVELNFKLNDTEQQLLAYRSEALGAEQVVRFEWSADLTFGELLEHLGEIPIPPYLNRQSEQSDNIRYQTVYSLHDGSVAAPTAGLHFSDALMAELRDSGVAMGNVTLHVGAGTFLPVKENDIAHHHMHTEHFELSIAMLKQLIEHRGAVVAVGTTTVRTIESLCSLGYRVIKGENAELERAVGQWEPYDIPDHIESGELLEALLEYLHKMGLDRVSSSTEIMIIPGYRFRLTDAIITNFHQPKSTLLLLVSAFIGERWRQVYDYALEHDFRFLSYGDSCFLERKGEYEER